MTEEVQNVKKLCGSAIEALGLIKQAEITQAVAMFYLGYYKMEIPAYVSICLMTGRFNELYIRPN